MGEKWGEGDHLKEGSDLSRGYKVLNCGNKIRRCIKNVPPGPLFHIYVNFNLPALGIMTSDLIQHSFPVEFLPVVAPWSCVSTSGSPFFVSCG